MADVKRLLDEATPLPWEAIHPSNVRWDTLSIHPLGIAANYADALLIVHAANRLPEYEAAVEALEYVCDMLVSKHIKESTAHDHSWNDCSYEPLVSRGREALRRLRDEVPA